MISSISIASCSTIPKCSSVSSSGFCYLDPPYWQTLGYDVPFGSSNTSEGERDKDGRRARDCDRDRPSRHAEVFGGLDFERIEIQYTLGGAEALGPRGELIFYSWNRADEPA